MAMRVEIFCCYAREDEVLLNQLKAHLKPLERQGLIEIWYDREIIAGQKWEEQINEHLNRAKVILLLISPDFMASDYCYSKEMGRAMERHKAEEACVIPVILRPVYWQGKPLGELQALPQDAKPIIGPDWHNPDVAFLDVTNGVRKVIEKLTKPSVMPPKKPDRVWPIIPERVTKIWTHQEQDYVDNVTFCPGTQWLVTTLRYGNILNFWDVTERKKVRALTLPCQLSSIAFSPDGRWMASFGGDKKTSRGEDDGTIKIWDVETGKLVRTLKHPPLLRQVVFSPDGLQLASASWDEQYYLWEVATGKLQQKVGGYLDIHILNEDHPPALRSPLAFSPNRQWLVGLDRLGSQLTAWQMGDGHIAKTFKELACVGITDLAFSPNGQWLACASNSGIHCCAHLWSVETGEIVQTFDAQTIRGKQTIRSYAGPRVFSPDGQPYGPRSISSLAFSPDGKFLAIGGETTLALWEIEARKFRRTFEVGASHLAFSPDGQWLATEGLSLPSTWPQSISSIPIEQLLRTYGGDVITLWKMQ